MLKASEMQYIKQHANLEQADAFSVHVGTVVESLKQAKFVLLQELSTPGLPMAATEFLRGRVQAIDDVITSIRRIAAETQRKTIY